MGFTIFREVEPFFGTKDFPIDFVEKLTGVASSVYGYPYLDKLYNSTPQDFLELADQRVKDLKEGKIQDLCELKWLEQWIPAIRQQLKKYLKKP